MHTGAVWRAPARFQGALRRAGGGSSFHQTIHVDASGSVNPDGFADEIVRRVRTETVRLVGDGMRQVDRNAPNRYASFERDGT